MWAHALSSLPCAATCLAPLPSAPLPQPASPCRRRRCPVLLATIDWPPIFLAADAANSMSDAGTNAPSHILSVALDQIPVSSHKCAPNRRASGRTQRTSPPALLPPCPAPLTPLSLSSSPPRAAPPGTSRRTPAAAPAACGGLAAHTRPYSRSGSACLSRSDSSGPVSCTGQVGRPCGVHHPVAQAPGRTDTVHRC